MMRCIIYGEGNAREHATFQVLRRESSQLDAPVFAMLGTNGLLLNEPGVFLVRALSEAVRLAQDCRARLALVLSQSPTAEGATEQFAMAGIPAFGATRAAWRLESSKVFAKDLMIRAGIPTSPMRTFQAPAAASDYIRSKMRTGAPVAIKTDGYFASAELRTCVTACTRQALDYIETVFCRGASAVLVEDYVSGRELSVHVIFDGSSYLLLPMVADQKRLLENDTGPMTNGMSAVAAAPWPTTLETGLRAQIIEPALRAFADAGLAYRGIVYFGVMLTRNGPVCLEFNVRSGSPEWLALLGLIKQPLAPALAATANGQLHRLGRISYRASISAAAFAVSTHDHAGIITGLNNVDPDVMITGESIYLRASGLRAGPSRVFALSARATSRDLVQQKLLNNLRQIHFPGMHYRTDLASQPLPIQQEQREQELGNARDLLERHLALAGAPGSAWPGSDGTSQARYTTSPRMPNLDAQSL
jgi:phosphoribosylamine--glycine ligase